MEKLSALYPSIATADFSGDIDEAITNYTQWLVGFSLSLFTIHEL